MLRLSKVCLCCIPIGLTLVSLLAVQPIRAATIGPTIAYMDPTDLGNQSNFNGSLFQNFTVNGAITVSQLGVFDSGQNGIAGALTVTIFSSTGTAVTPTETFTGNAGTLIGGDRFLPISPVTLPPGDYSLTTTGWGGQDLNGNFACINNSSCPGGPFTAPTLNTGNGLVTYTGVNFGSGGYLPPVPGSSPDQFNAGSFVFAPEPATAILLAVGLLLLVLVPRLCRN